MSDMFSRYLANNPAPRRPVPRAAAPVPRAATPAARGGMPGPPDFTALLAQLAAGPMQRTDTDWNALLNARMQPFIDTISQSTNVARGQNEYRFEQASAANRGLGESFLKLLTGGKTGDEASQYAKEQFGGSYLPAQAMQIAADTLRGLTNDFDDGDWEITGQYMQAMQQIPGIREELRAKIEASDQQDHATKVQTASLLLDETWKLYQANRNEFEFGVKTKEEQRQFNEQMKLAAGELGVKGVNAQSGAVRAAVGAKNAEIRAAELELKNAKQAYAKAKDKVSQRQAQERINVSKGQLEVAKQKAKATNKKSSPQQSAEADLAVTILTEERDAILGKPGEYPDEPRVGAMSYQQAYDYVRALAEQTMGNRSSSYIDNWVRQRLRSLGLTGPQKLSGR